MKAAPAKAKALFSHRQLYLAWAVVSAVGLTVARYIDPYVFGFSAFGAAFVSGFLILGAVVLSWRLWPWAVLSAIPTVLAFMLLSTYRWA
ncbi:hypothetical protein H010_16024 [Hydrogenophaga taeniospiralis CCUG 15921]|uniref:Uncharacterized protein n=1 Tax=Hydrogenophaga taeniospiralis CCUG 15921 TaxID=1281780 RepID=A0A9X4NSW9_9BURK|nr:hypothetical protein [Hydrogenophaga taeniospiralis]MDG5976777.1 hypothetical protein [Hydrogenophaga taeniospiralis CCUG 15921]